MPKHLSSRLLALVLGLASCWGRTPPATFYILERSPSASEPPSAGPQPRREVTVALGPVELPGYLDRPQIVTRQPPNKLHVDEFHRWGSALSEAMLTALHQRIAAELGSRGRVVAYPAPSALPLTHRVTFHVHRFDGELGGRVVLEVTWVIERVDVVGKPVTLRETRLHERSGSSDHASLVAAMSRLVARLGREVALEISRLSVTTKVP